MWEHDKVVINSSFKKLLKHIVQFSYDKLEISSILIFGSMSNKFFSILSKWLQDMLLIKDKSDNTSSLF